FLESLNLPSSTKIYLSISLPQFKYSSSIKGLKSNNFKSNIFEKGNTIYNIKLNRGVKAKYLLIEGEKRANYTPSTLLFRVKTSNKELLKIYLKASFRFKKELKSMPEIGAIGQQGFNNYANYFLLKEIK
ncbi:MAG: hypothetical protein GXN91_03570, partial [Epsilonproteobacteria bacterium]|nr:hypothetical protein [Campylobacterota bacterium]